MQTLKTFQIDSCPEIIWIKNLERKPENEIYDNVLGILIIPVPQSQLSGEV